MQVLAGRLSRVIASLRARVLLVAIVILHQLAYLTQLVLDELYLVLLGRRTNQVDLFLLTLRWH